MALTPITRHFGEALVKLAMPFWGKPRMAALLQAMVQRVQEIENCAWDVLERYTLGGADTARLDVLGRIVGQPRFWSDDEIYRAVLRGKIRANRSRGLTDDIVDVVQAITPSSDPVHAESYSPATVFVWPEAAIDPATILIALEFLLPRTRAAGVQMHLFTLPGGLPDGAVWDEATWDDGTYYWSEEIL